MECAVHSALGLSIVLRTFFGLILTGDGSLAGIQAYVPESHGLTAI
jgi:hypothetical protein